MDKDVPVCHGLLLQYVESGDEHTTGAYLGLHQLVGAEQEVLQHFELMLIERVIVGVCLGVGGLFQSGAY